MQKTATAAAALSLGTIAAYYSGFPLLVSWGFRVPMGIVSCIGVLLVAAGIVCKRYHKTITGTQIIFVIFAFVAIWAKMNNIQLYPTQEGSGGWYRPSSSLSLLSMMLLILAQWLSTDPARVIACGLGGASIATMYSWITLTAQEAGENRLGSIAYSFPTAVCILLLCISTFRSTRSEAG